MEICSLNINVYGANLTPTIVVRGKMLAFDAIHGGFKRMFQSVPSLREEKLNTNPSFIVEYVVDDENKLLRFFICLYGCLEDFMVGCHPFIDIGNTYMKSKFRSVLLMIIDIDGYNQMFLIAFGCRSVKIILHGLGSWVFYIGRPSN